MLTLRHIALIESPVSHVVRITRAGQPVNVVDASLLGLDTNNPVTATNDIIPVIQFSDVPIETGFENLIRLSEVKAVLDPRVSDYRDIVNLRWEKITAKQAIVALCENYNLSLVKDANRGVIEIKPVEAKKHHRRQTH